MNKIYKKKMFTYLCCLFILFLLLALSLFLPHRPKQRERAILISLNACLNYDKELPADLSEMPGLGRYFIKCGKSELSSLKETFIIYNKNYKIHSDWIAIVMVRDMNPFNPDAYILKKDGKIITESNVDDYLANYSDLEYYIYH